MSRPSDCALRLEPEQCLAPLRVRRVDSSTSRRILQCTGSKADPQRVRIRARRERIHEYDCPNYIAVHFYTTQQSQHRGSVALPAQGFFEASGAPNGLYKKGRGALSPDLDLWSHVLISLDWLLPSRAILCFTERIKLPTYLKTTRRITL